MIAGVPVGRMLLILLLGCLMIPVPPSMDIRGWSETCLLYTSDAADE